MALVEETNVSRPDVIVAFCDNAAITAATSMGTSSAADLRRLVEGLWQRLDASGTNLLVHFVPSRLNPADAPSRGRGSALGVRWRMRMSGTWLVDLLLA